MIYRIWPFPVLELEDLPKSINDFDAYSFGFFILIKRHLTKEQKEEIIRHEDTHCKQFFRLFLIHSFKYNYSKKYRLECEIEAYYNQLKIGHNETLIFDIMLASQEIWEHYDLSDIYTKNEIQNRLLSKFGIPLL